MPRFLFQVQQAGFPEIPIVEDVLSDSLSAQRAALGMCADLAKDIVAGLTEDSEWGLEVRDESGKPVFRLRLIAESLERPELAADSRNGVTSTAIDHAPDEFILQQLGAAVLLCWETLPLSARQKILDQTDDVIGPRPVPGVRNEIAGLLSRRQEPLNRA